MTDQLNDAQIIALSQLRVLEQRANVHHKNARVGLSAKMRMIGTEMKEEKTPKGVSIAGHIRAEEEFSDDKIIYEHHQ